VLIPSPTSTEVQGVRKVGKTIKAPIFLCVCVTYSTFDDYYCSDMKLTGSSESVGPPGTVKSSQLPVRLAGRFRESPSVALAMKPRFGPNCGLMLPVDLVYTGAAQNRIMFFGCEYLACEALLKVLTRDYYRSRSADASRQWDRGKGVTRAPCGRQQGNSFLGRTGQGVEHDVPNEMRACMQFVCARTVLEVLNAVFGVGLLPWRADAHRSSPAPLEQALYKDRE
jgi:hypothetical protein